MKISSLTLKNYRNHAQAKFEFDDKLTLILGNNGAGKTNILEAIHLISTSKSQRARYDKDIIKYEQEFCTIQAKTLIESHEELMELQILKNATFENASIKKCKINKTPKSISSFCGSFLSVLFTPEDLDQLNNSPSARRRYLDMVLSQTYADYKKTHTQYVHTVKTRNKLLEQICETGKGRDQLWYWNEQYVNLGQYIQKLRDEFFGFVKEQISQKGQELNQEKNGLSLEYIKNEITHDRVNNYQEKEITAKTSLLGPHRDDFEVLLENKNISYFGSRGQQRTSLLALKLSELDFIDQKKGVRPVLLLDDIFSELDDNHRDTVLKCIGSQQTIITTTHLPEQFEPGTVIRL